MPTYITQGRYTRDAIKGMIVKPEDRADAVARLLSKVGGRLISYYLTFGEYDFLAIAEAVPLPMIVYNIPGRTGCDLTTDTLARLVGAQGRVVGLKEATGSVARMQEAVRRLGDRLAVLSGDDPLNLPLYSVGGRGCISVVSNVEPALVAQAWDAAAAGDLRRAAELHRRTMPLSDVLFLETNPIPVKAALAMMGLITDEIRLPLVPMSAAPRERLRAVLAEMGKL